MLVLVSVELIVTEPVASLYATDVAPPPVNIPPTISSICSWTRLTAPLETEKSVALKDAIPLLVVVASSPLTVTVEPANAVSIPSPPAISTTVPSGTEPAPPLSA